jgi:membrane-associated HD superfamily phosphohydrolase
MNLNTLNIWAVVAAAVSAFLIGGLWYSPVLLGAAWKRANGFTADPPAAGAKGFAIAFLLSVVMSFNLAMFLNAPGTTLAWGATAGFLAGFGWGAMGLGIIAVFEHRPLSYVLVNGGYLTAALTVMGAILGGWR